MLTSSHIANDNSPGTKSGHSAHAGSLHERLFARGKSSGQTLAESQIPAEAQTLARAQSVTSQSADLSNYSPVWQPNTPKPQKLNGLSNASKAARSTKGLFIAASIVWIMSLLANIYVMASAPVNPIHLPIALLAMWSSLFISFLAYKRNRTALAEMGAMAALLSFTLALYMSSLKFGTFLPPIIGAALTSLAGLALAFSLNSKLALRLGAIIGAAWLIFAIPGQLVTNGSSYLLWGLPAFCLTTAYLALRLSDTPSLLMSVLTSYTGLALYIYLTSPTLSILAPLSLSVIGLAHNRFGKFAELSGIFGSHIHRLFGWAAGMTGLLGMLMFWQSWGALVAESADSVADKVGLNIVLNSLLAACVLAIAVFELWRAKLGHQGRPKALIVIALPILFICASLSVDALSLAAAPFNPAALPFPSLILSGIIFTLGVGLLINGLRQSKSLMVLCALLSIGALFAITGHTAFQSYDHAMIFFMTFFICSLFALGLTGNAKHRAYKYDYKYA